MCVAEVLPLAPRSGEDLDKLRGRLFEAAADLKLGPLPTTLDLAERLHGVGRELDSIRESLRLLIHLAELENSGFEETVARVNDELSTGWTRESASVDDVIERLRSKRFA